MLVKFPPLFAILFLPVQKVCGPPFTRGQDAYDFIRRQTNILMAAMTAKVLDARLKAEAVFGYPFRTAVHVARQVRLHLCPDGNAAESK
jgi:hypothetical protein